MRTFSFSYPGGQMIINVGLFFGTAPASNIKKMLKLMQLNCRAKQKDELLLDLIEEDRQRKELLDKLGDMEFEREQLLSSCGFIDKSAGRVKRDLAWPEKAIVNQRKKIQAAVDLVKGADWY